MGQLEYSLASGGRAPFWEELPEDYNELPALQDGDVITIRTKAIPFIPGYYRMAPTSDRLHPDWKWYDVPPWQTYAPIQPWEMEHLTEDGKVISADPSYTKEQVRAAQARKRNDHHVNKKIIRCAYDKCGHTITKSGSKGLPLWTVAVQQGWKVAHPENAWSTDLYCPSRHDSTGEPLTDMDGEPYED